MGNFSAPFSALVTRLTAHCLAAGRLDGYKFEAAPGTDVTGIKDFPNIRLDIPSLSESMRGQVLIPSSSVVVLVSTRRKASNGMPDPTKLVDHLEAIEAVIDAIRHNENDVLDVALGGSLVKPVTFRTGKQLALDISINTELLLTLEPRPYDYGSLS